MAAVLEKKIPAALEGKSAGKTFIRDVRVELREDSDDRVAAFVVLVLSDPPQGMDAWDVEDLWELRRIVRGAINDKLPDLDMPWYVVFEPENPELGEE
ncbi:MAG: hypothetical protein ACPGYP_07060 [Solirubrobacterales bacterium]